MTNVLQFPITKTHNLTDKHLEAAGQIMIFIDTPSPGVIAKLLGHKTNGVSDERAIAIWVAEQGDDVDFLELLERLSQHLNQLMDSI